MKRVFRFIRALYNYICFGQDVTPEIHKYRHDICMNCEKLSGKTCSICGCFVKTKTKWSTEKCPIDKWSEILEYVEKT